MRNLPKEFVRVLREKGMSYLPRFMVRFPRRYDGRDEPAMKLQAVLFDFDMTLIDTSQALLHNVNMIARAFSRPECSREQLLQVIGYNTRDFWTALLGDNRPEYGAYYLEHCVPIEAQRMFPAAGAVDCVEALRSAGMKVGCASNRIGPMRVIRLMKLEGLMDCVPGADDVERAKPYPDVLLKAASLLEAAPERTLYIGDTPIDAQAANAAGMKCVCVTTSNARETLEAAGAWRVIPDLTGLVPLLKAEGMI